MHRYHPAAIHHWKRERAARGCGVYAGSEHAAVEEPGIHFMGREHEGFFGHGSFGVRRPLRVLAYKLQLSDAQVAGLAQILNDLKTERAQAAVEDRRTLAIFADAVSAETFDEEKATQGATLRTESTQRLSAEVVKAIGRIHELLTPEQRSQFAYLIRTGVLLL